MEQAIRTVEQIGSDSKIIFDYAAFCEKSEIRPDCFYDTSLLPYPKEAIITGIERQLVRSPPAALVDWLRSGAMFIWNFLEGAGPDPLPFKGLDISQGNTSHSIAIAEREEKEVEERIATALRIRTALRRSRQAVQSHRIRS